MTLYLRKLGVGRMAAAALFAMCLTTAFALTEVPASANFGGCCGVAYDCGWLRDPIQVCVTDPNCGSPGEWCCWGQPHCPA